MRNKWVMMPLLLAGFLAFIAVGGLVVQQLWNWLLPGIFGTREVTYWQALGLLALSRILFGGFGMGRASHGGRRRNREDWWKAQQDRARMHDREPLPGE